MAIASQKKTRKNYMSAPDEKAVLMGRLIELKSKGMNDFQVSKELGIHPATSKKWWLEHLGESSSFNPAEKALARAVKLESAIDKAIKDFHADKSDGRNIVGLMQAADRYNGLQDYLARRSLENLPTSNDPPLLSVVVRNVPIELPPGDDDDDEPINFD